MTRRVAWPGLWIVGAVVVLSSATEAGVLNVSSTVDALAAGDGACTLREAVLNANLASGGDLSGGDCEAADAGLDEIRLPAGRYALTLTGGDEDEGLTGDLDVLDDLRIVSASGAPAVLDGLQADRVLHGLGENLELRGIVIENGTPSESGVTGGGGIRFLGRTLILRDVVVRGCGAEVGGGINASLSGTALFDNLTVEDNVATGSAGGLLLGGDATLRHSTFSRNIASSGAAIALSGASGGAGLTIAIEACDFDSNQAENSGGAIQATAQTLTVRRSNFVSNTATRGGAIYGGGAGTIDVSGGLMAENTATFGGAIQATLGGAVRIEDATLRANQAVSRGGAIEAGPLELVGSTLEDNHSGGGGGAVTAGEFFISRTVFRGNSSDGGGGALAVRPGGGSIELSSFEGNEAYSGGAIHGGLIGDTMDPLTIRHSTFLSNRAVDGGGAIVGAGPTAIYDSTISGNQSNGGGGAVFCFRESDCSLDFVTVTDNDASLGVVQVNNAPVRIKNSLIAGNRPRGCYTFQGSIVSLGYNLDDDGTCAVGAIGDQTAADPLLAPIQDNGGAGPTHALLPGSPARDAADPACLRIDGSVAETDQRGFPRPQDGDGANGAACDIGAFEAPDAMPALPPPVPDGTFGQVMRAGRADVLGSTVDLQWDVTLCTSADFHLVIGNLEDVDLLQPIAGACGLSPSGTAEAVPVPTGNLWFLVVANDGADLEGAWGDSTAGPRNPGTPSAVCTITRRDDTATCPKGSD